MDETTPKRSSIQHTQPTEAKEVNQGKVMLKKYKNEDNNNNIPEIA